MAIELYIGYNSHHIEGAYFINSTGENLIDNHTKLFEDINSLLFHLKETYKKRKAYLKEFSEDFPEEDKKKIIGLLEEKVTKIIFNHRLIVLN